MTAEIGVLNKTAIVLAADSAVTIDNGRKVYKTANKIFPLSLVHPVGIMVYNNSQWMGIPWEIIIKEYCQNLKGESFPYIKDYMDDFIKKLKRNYKKRLTSEKQIDFVREKLIDTLSILSDITNLNLDEKIKAGALKRAKTEMEEAQMFSSEFQKTLQTAIKFVASQKGILVEFKKYGLREFSAAFKPKVIEIIDYFIKDNSLQVPRNFKSLVLKLLYLELIKDIDEYDSYSGIVIAGYGNDEIYPVIYEYKISGYIQGKLRFKYHNHTEIGDENMAVIAPIAQRDMVDTFVQGLSPIVESEMCEFLKGKLTNILKDFQKKINIKEHKLLVKNLSEAYREFRSNLKSHLAENHVEPILSTVSNLSKEGMVELAESLVNITSLKRKTSSEVESVGGPVDVVIITKTEGFIWVKNKSVIDQQLNQHFYTRLEKSIWDNHS